MPSVRQRSEAVDVDCAQLVWRRLKDVAIVMDLHELAPVGGRATGRRDRRRLERFAKVREGLISRGRSHPGLLPLANLRFEVSRLLPAVYSEPDISAARRALQRKLLPHPRHQLGPGNPGCVVGTRRCMVRGTLTPALSQSERGRRRGIPPLADVPDRERRDGPPQLVIRRKHPVVAMPVLPRRRDEIGESIEELKRREFDDAMSEPSWIDCAEKRRNEPRASQRRKRSRFPTRSSCRIVEISNPRRGTVQNRVTAAE
jgi:hypothetical protein